MIPKEKATEVLEQMIEIAKNYKEPGIPKEKAKELWNKYVEAKIVTEGKYSNYRGLTTEHAKVCALIAVDEILDFMMNDDIESETCYWANHPLLSYWYEVKKEIELL